jgi:hypothetical protein
MGLGEESAKGLGIDNPAPTNLINSSKTPTPTATVGPLSITQTKALLTQIGHSESGSNYASVNALNQLGKYRIGAKTLSDQGYIKPGAFEKFGNNAVNYPTSWTGKDGIVSKESFLLGNQTQEKVMQNSLNSNYQSLLSSGAIKSNDNPTKIAGLLSVSHSLGSDEANKWSRTGSGAAANGTSGSTYFNMGRYSVDILASFKK